MSLRPDEKVRVFCCHVQEDHAAEQQLHEQLSQQADVIYSSQTNAPLGEELNTFLVDQIANADILVFLFSRAFLNHPAGQLQLDQPHNTDERWVLLWEPMVLPESHKLPGTPLHPEPYSALDAQKRRQLWVHVHRQLRNAVARIRHRRHQPLPVYQAATFLEEQSDNPVIDAVKRHPLAMQIMRGFSAVGTQASDFGGNETRPLKILRRLGQLVGQLKLKLSWLESLLLGMTPFVVQAMSFRILDALVSGNTREPLVTNELVVRYRRFKATQQDVIDRIDVLRRQGAAAEAEWVAAWLMRRFLHGERIQWRGRQIASVLGGLPKTYTALDELLSPDLLAGLARAANMGPTQLCELDKGHHSEIFVEPSLVQLRRSLLGTLLLWAERETLSSWDLSETLIHHLGEEGGLTLSALHADFATSSGAPTFWLDPDKRITTLRATCSNAILDFALREYAERWDTFLREQGQALAAIFFGIPVQCTADLTPRSPDENDARPSYHTPHVQFSMNVERVRRLLMADSLWGDPTMAYRELYQNALDACRYRRSVTAYYNETRDPTLRFERKYVPAITFHENEIGGRRYVECQDNGVGMNPDTVRFLFSRAGNQFSRSTEYLLEQAKWREKNSDLDFAPNSQFGIGVFSYFLVAESIEIVTRKISSEHCEPESEAWRVIIRAPSGLFTITQLRKEEAPEDAGTRIRLYLRPVPSGNVPWARAIDILRRLVWFTEFSLQARGYGDSAHWQAGALSPFLHPFVIPQDPESTEPRLFWLAPRFPGLAETSDTGRERPLLREFLPNTKLHSSRYEFLGRVLVDGIVTDHTVPFVILNLYGPDEKPRLSLDRNRILSWNVERSLARLHERLDGTPLIHDWLDEYWQFDPIGCSRIVNMMNAENKQWLFCNERVAAGSSRESFCYLPQDATALREELPYLQADDSYIVSGRILLSGDNFSQTLFILWRAAYWQRLQRSLDPGGRAYGQPLPGERALHFVNAAMKTRWAAAHAGPLDALLMSRCQDWLEWAPFEVAKAACLSEVGIRHAWDTIAQLCSVLDMIPPQRPAALAGDFTIDSLRFDELCLLSQSGDAIRPWLSQDSLGWFALRVAVRTQLPLHDSVQRLIQLAARIGVQLQAPWQQEFLQTLEPITQDDLALLDSEPDGSAGCLLSMEELTPLQLLRTARARGWTILRCAERLDAFLPLFGWTRPSWLLDPSLHEELSSIADDDLRLLRRPELQSWVQTADELTPTHLLRLQEHGVALPIQTCVERITALARALRWPEPDWTTEQIKQLSNPVLDLLRTDYRSGGEWSFVINARVLFQYTQKCGDPLRECAQRFLLAAAIAGVPVPKWQPELLPADMDGTQLAFQLLQNEGGELGSLVYQMQDDHIPLAQVRVASKLSGLSLDQCAVLLERLATGMAWQRPRWCDAPQLLVQVNALDEEAWQRVQQARALTLPELLEYAARGTPASGVRLAPLLYAMRVLDVERPPCDESALLALGEVHPVDAQLARYAAAWRHFRGLRPASAGLLVALSALVAQPLSLVRTRLMALAPLTGLAPPDDEAAYLGVRC